MSKTYWDPQIAKDGQWVSVYSGPFECIQDAEDIIDHVIECAKIQGVSVVTRIIEITNDQAMNMTEMVREFHRAFLVDCPARPTIPRLNIAALRSSLIDEERLELFCATTPVDALDAIADLLYVVHGAALAYGFNGKQVEAALSEVRRSSIYRPWTRKEVIAGIDEERLELFIAEKPAEALDAIAGLLYVVHGAAVAYGFTGEQVEAAFREVHRSNMSKLWTREEVDAGIGDNIARPVLGEMFVVTRPDGKVVKSPSYSPARLEEIAGGAR